MTPYRKKRVKIYHKRFRHPHINRILIGNCGYHICNKRTELYRCKYCRELFCHEHLKAKPPSLPTFIHSDLPEWLKGEIDKEWENNSGHPCSVYFDIWKGWKEKERDRIYGPHISKGGQYTKPPIIGYPPAIERPEGQHTTPIIETQRKVTIFERSKRYLSWHKKGILTLIIIIILGYFLYSSIQSGQMKSIFQNAQIAISTSMEDFFKTEPISNKTKDVEQSILKYTNIERKNAGLKQLIWDDKLSDVARYHSLDMATNNYFSHENLQGEDPTTRAIKQGYNVHKELGGGWYSDGIGENIGKMPTGDVTGMGYVASDADSIGKAHVDSWMDSPGHKANILNNQYDYIGVGVAFDGTYYVATQDFK